MRNATHLRHFSKRPKQLTPEFIDTQYQQLISRVDAAENSSQPDLWIDLYGQWDELKSYMGGEQARLHYIFAGNQLDSELETQDAYMREKITPVVQKHEGVMTEAIVKSRHRDALGKRFGGQLLRVLETSVKPLDPRNADERIEESRLATEFTMKLAKAEVEFQGEKMTLSKASSFLNSKDEAVRKEAWLVGRRWYLAHHAELAEIFSKLTRVRHQMGLNLGDPNYLKLGYLRMGRTDYGPAESKKFRENVRKYAVPLQNRNHEAHARALGQTKLRPWDVGYDPALSLPMGIVPIETQLQKAQQVFDRISPRLSQHFSTMREAELIDLENRKGKAPGAFCTAFPDEPRVAILCNSTGSASDVATLMHEMGHAFQAWESLANIEVTDLLWPTMDAAEIHSMGMEYLSLSRMDEFFTPENAEKFRKERWKRAIELMCYVAIVDEFQHWVYENPKASPAERDQAWTSMAKIYQPSLDFEGVEELLPMRWYAQGHIFRMPFYYIDYAIAETGAMQLSLLDLKDPKRAIEVYLKLCQLGGSLSVLKIFESAGLESPFEASTMEKLMNHAGSQLGMN